MALVIQGKKVKGKWVEKEVDDPSCMSEKEVKEFIGENNWKRFLKWMEGQTSPILSDNSAGYYKWDVEKFHKHYILGIPQMTIEDIDKIFKEMDKKHKGGN